MRKFERNVVARPVHETRVRPQRVTACPVTLASPDSATHALLWAQSADAYRLLVDSVRDYAILLLDPHGRILSWNAGAERIKGWQANEIIGQHFSAFYLPAEVAAGKCDRELASALRDGSLQDEGWRTRKDGSRFWQAWSSRRCTIATAATWVSRRSPMT